MIYIKTSRYEILKCPCLNKLLNKVTVTATSASQPNSETVLCPTPPHVSSFSPSSGESSPLFHEWCKHILWKLMLRFNHLVFFMFHTNGLVIVLGAIGIFELHWCHLELHKQSKGVLPSRAVFSTSTALKWGFFSRRVDLWNGLRVPETRLSLRLYGELSAGATTTWPCVCVSGAHVSTWLKCFQSFMHLHVSGCSVIN